MTAHLRIISDSRVGGILIPFSNRNDDRYHNYWNQETDFGLDRYVVRPVFYYHAEKDEYNTRAGTVIDSAIQVRPDGVYIEADINPNDPSGAAFLELVNRNRAGWSSGVMPNHIRARQSDGYISRWWFNEATGADIAHTAAQRQLTKIAHIRAFYPGVDLPGNDDEYLLRSPFVMTMPETPNPAQPPAPQPEPERTYTASEFARIMAMFQQPAAAAPAAPAAPAEAETPPTRTLAPIIPAPAAPAAAPIQNLRVSVGSQWDTVHPYSMLMAYTVRQQNVGGRFDKVNELTNARMFDETFFRALLDKLEWAHDDWENLDHHRAMTVNSATRVNKAPANIRIWDEEAAKAWKTYVPNLRANEAMATTLTNKGAEIIPTLMNTLAYYMVHLEARILPLFDSFQMPSNPFDYPVIRGGPGYRYLPEAVNQANWNVQASNIKPSTIFTDKVRFQVFGSAGAMTLITQELIESTAVNMMDVWARNYLIASAHAIDYVILNADTEAAAVTNVSTDSAIASSVYDIGMLTNGLRKLALVTDNRKVAEATVTKNTLNKIAKLLGNPVGLIGRDKANLVAIIDPFVAYVYDELSDYETWMNVQNLATLMTGQVGMVKGVPLIVTEDLPKSNATGYLTEARDGTKGSTILTWLPGFKVGRFRDVRTRSFDVAGVEGMVVQSSFRICLGELDAGSVGVAYNSTV